LGKTASVRKGYREDGLPRNENRINGDSLRRSYCRIHNYTFLVEGRMQRRIAWVTERISEGHAH
jgi:hypothetical protein